MDLGKNLLFVLLFRYGWCFTAFNSPGLEIFQTFEELPTNSTIGYLEAVTDLNSRITYELDDHNQLSVNASTGRISNKAVIDFEKTKTIFLTAYASTALEPNKAEIRVLIEIQNINDNYPIFEEGGYESHAPEDIAIGGYVTRVTANDADETDILSYTIVTHNDLFKVGSSNGKVTTLKKLDHENTTRYVVNISASDGELSTSTLLTIFIDDVDDQGAMFDQEVYHTDLLEGEYKTDTFIATVHAFDMDLQINDPVVYSLTKGEIDGVVISINTTTGDVYLKGNVDREKLNEINIPVEATSTKFSAVKATIQVQVIDRNDNRPEFTHGGFRAKTSESSIIGTPILRVTAVDKDQGNNSALMYRILNDEYVPFLITDEGEIQVYDTLDRETKDIYNLTVKVTEKYSQEQFSNTTKVFIEIVDANDNTPKFDLALYNLSVNENVETPHQITQLHASDADIGANAEVSFLILPEQTPHTTHFHLNKSTGVLTLTRPFDREKVSLVSFNVLVRDGEMDGTYRSAVASVRVYINDVNDNQPQFQEGAYSAKVHEMVANGSRVLFVTAIDIDSSEEIRYSIISGNDDKLFVIHKSGEILTNGVLDREMREVHRFVVRAIDNGGLHDDVNVTIEIADINDNRPIFGQQGGYYFEVLEGVTNAYVGQVQASDEDKGLAGKISYRLQNTNTFTVNQTSGVISTLSAVDRELNDMYIFRVTARDSAIDYRSSLVEVTVKVLDVNDNAPYFDRHVSRTLSINVNTLNGTTLRQLRAKDIDSGQFAESLYTSNNIPDFLSLTASGDIILDSPTPSNIVDPGFTVTAQNKMAPFYNSSIELTIEVTSFIMADAPVFELNRYVLEVFENEPPGTFLIDLNSTYANALEDSRFIYSMVASDSDVITVAKDGVVTTLRGLDREEESEFTATVSVSMEGLSNQNFALLFVRVKDRNDNPPKFNQTSSSNIYVRNDAPYGTVVKQIKAYDPDIDDELSFAISLGNEAGLFEMETNTGVLKTSKGMLSDDNVFVSLTTVVMDNKFNASSFVNVTLLGDSSIGRLLTYHTSDYIYKKRDDLARLLTNLTDGRVSIDRIVQLDERYKVEFYVVMETGAILPSSKIKYAIDHPNTALQRNWLTEWQIAKETKKTHKALTNGYDEDRYMLLGIILGLSLLLLLVLFLVLCIRLQANKRARRTLSLHMSQVYTNTANDVKSENEPPSRYFIEAYESKDVYDTLRNENLLSKSFYMASPESRQGSAYDNAGLDCEPPATSSDVNYTEQGTIRVQEKFHVSDDIGQSNTDSPSYNPDDWDPPCKSSKSNMDDVIENMDELFRQESNSPAVNKTISTSL